MCLNEQVNSHSKFQLVSKATTDETPIGTILTWANIGAGHYTQWCSIIILLSILYVASLRKTDLSNIKMNVPFPKEYTDQITSNWSRCGVYRKKIAAVLLDRDRFALI